MIKGDNGVTEMTAKSGMECNRLLFLGGKGRLIVIRYACLWQNAPDQFHVRLSILMYTTAPLQSNQKYVYRKIELHVYKITRYTKKSDLYPIVYQRLTKAFLKGEGVSKCPHPLFYAQSPVFLKPGLCYFLKFLYL